MRPPRHQEGIRGGGLLPCLWQLKQNKIKRGVALLRHHPPFYKIKAQLVLASPAPAAPLFFEINRHSQACFLI